MHLILTQRRKAKYKSSKSKRTQMTNLPITMVANILAPEDLCVQGIM